MTQAKESEANAQVAEDRATADEQAPKSSVRRQALEGAADALARRYADWYDGSIGSLLEAIKANAAAKDRGAGKIMNDAAVDELVTALTQYLLERPIAQLGRELDALTAQQVQQLNSLKCPDTVPYFTFNDALTRAMLASREATRGIPSRLSSGVGLSWMHAPDEIERLAQVARTLSREHQLALLLALPRDLSTRISRRIGVAELSQFSAADLASADDGVLVSTILYKDGGYQIARLAEVWRALSASLQARLLQRALTSAGPAADWNAFSLLLVAAPEERAPYLSRLDNVVDAQLFQTMQDQSLIPWIQALRAELPQATRQRFDTLMVEHNRGFAVWCGLTSPTNNDIAAGFQGPLRAAEASDDYQRVPRIDPPVMQFDHGFLDDGKGGIDESKRRAPTLEEIGAKAQWAARLAGAATLRPDLAEATQTYAHFLGATGAPLELDYEKFLLEDSSGPAALAEGLTELRRVVVGASATLGPREHLMSTRTNAISVYPSSENWLKALGAHLMWLEAAVFITGVNGRKSFTIDVTIHAADRYNFNPGANDVHTQTPDAANGVFEVTGLAKEFMTYGTARRRMSFSIDGPDDRAEGVPQQAWVAPVDLLVSRDDET